MFEQYKKMQDEREAATGMRQSLKGMVIKLCVGFIFAAAGVRFISDGDIPLVLFSLIIGLGFISWGLVPYLIATDNMKRDGKKNTLSVVISRMRQSFGAMVAKITIGLLFIVVMLDEIGTQTDAFIFSFIIGLAFIAWGLVPFILTWKNKKKQDIDELMAMPLYEYEKDEAEKLAEKYENK